MRSAVKTMLVVVGGAGAMIGAVWASGLVQRLANGNYFVSVSNSGTLVETTREGKMVWQFWSPWRGKNHRLPLRAIRLEGAVLERARDILAGMVDPPRVADGETPA
jgi:hypothetical protein